MSQFDEKGASLRMRMKKRNSTMILKLRVMKIVLNFQINKVPRVFYLYLVNISLTFLIL